MSELTVITKQTYLLTGNKKTNGTFKAVLVDVLDESSNECVCRELIDGNKHFNIIIKNDSDAFIGQETADMLKPYNDIIGVDYLKSDDVCSMYFVRYLVGDHTNEEALSDFFSAVDLRIKEVAMFRGWSISNKGALTVKKPEYFY